jgi:hypothetical protein
MATPTPGSANEESIARTATKKRRTAHACHVDAPSSFLFIFSLPTPFLHQFLAAWLPASLQHTSHVHPSYATIVLSRTRHSMNRLGMFVEKHCILLALLFDQIVAKPDAEVAPIMVQ